MPDPRAAQNLQMPHPQDLKGGQMPRSSPGGGGGGWAQLESTDALGWQFLTKGGVGRPWEWGCILGLSNPLWDGSLKDPKNDNEVHSFRWMSFCLVVFKLSVF